MQRPVQDTRSRDGREDDTSSAAPEVIPLSVTRDDHFSFGSECRWLASGLDSLDLGVSIAWDAKWDLFTEKLDAWKLRASGTKGILFDAEPCMILPAGKDGNYRWHLQWPEFHLFLARHGVPQGKTPNAFVSFNSRALWESSIDGAVSQLTEIIEALGGTILGMKPSRCDLAADFFLPGGVSLDALLSYRVPPHVQHSHHMRGEDLETFYQGSAKSPTRLRIYNKGLEIARRGEKWWFLQVWNVASEEGVWRVEFQLRRHTLKKYGINNLHQLKTQCAGLWQYLTEKWFSLRLNDNGNTSRCTVHPWWKMVQGCSTSFGDLHPLGRKFEGEPADSSRIVKYCAGSLASFAAREGLEDFETASALLVARMETYWQSRDFGHAVATRSIPLGFPACAGTAELSDSSSMEACDE